MRKNVCIVTNQLHQFLPPTLLIKSLLLTAYLAGDSSRQVYFDNREEIDELKENG